MAGRNPSIFQFFNHVVVIVVIYSSQLVAATNEHAGDRSVGDDAYIKLVSGNYAELERQYNAPLVAYAAGKISEDELSSRFEIFFRADGLAAQLDAWVSAYPRSY